MLVLKFPLSHLQSLCSSSVTSKELWFEVFGSQTRHLKLSPCKSEDLREMFDLLCVPGKHCQVPAVILGDTFIGKKGIGRVMALPSSSLATHPQESGLGMFLGTSCFVQAVDAGHRCGDSRAVPWPNELLKDLLLPHPWWFYVGLFTCSLDICCQLSQK